VGDGNFQTTVQALFIEFFLPYAVIKKNLDNGDVSSLLVEKSLAVNLNDCSIF